MVMPGLLVFGILFSSMYAYVNFTEAVRVEEKQSNPRTLVIGEGLTYYQNTEMNSPFFSKFLSKDLIDELDAYESAYSFHKLISEVDPDIIVDELRVMEKLMFRYPYLQENYRLSGPAQYRRINN